MALLRRDHTHALFVVDPQPFVPGCPACEHNDAHGLVNNYRMPPCARMAHGVDTRSATWRACPHGEACQVAGTPLTGGDSR